MKLLSIIVPIYNVEKYMDKCINSIVNQTYKKLEIILVDDGSSDSSGFKCDEWAKKDKRIKVIHKENGGIASVRNIGVKEANGDYITFVDADDYIDLDCYKKTLEDNSNYDIITFNFYYDYLTYKEIGIKNFQNENFEYELYKSDSILGFTWNKIYKSNIIKDVTSNEKVNVCQDMLLNSNICVKHNNIKYKYIDIPLYYYYKNNQTSQLNSKYMKDSSKFIVYSTIMKRIEIYDKELSYRRKMQFIVDYNDFKIINKNYKEDKIFTSLLPVYKQYKKDVVKTKFKYRIKTFLCEHLNKLYFKYRSR